MANEAKQGQVTLPQTHALFHEAIRRGLNVRIRATGVSMFPYIWPKEHIIFRPLREGEVPQEGAVLLVDRGKDVKFVAHRLVGHDGETLVIRGDSNPEPDEPATLGNIAGLATAIEGRFFHIRRSVPANGGLFWKLLKGLAPASYWCNGMAVKVALAGWRVIRLFIKKKD